MLYIVLTRHTNDPTNINVRFEVLLYTDSGSTTEFLNKYNDLVNREESVIKIILKPLACLKLDLLCQSRFL